MWEILQNLRKWNSTPWMVNISGHDLMNTITAIDHMWVLLRMLSVVWIRVKKQSGRRARHPLPPPSRRTSSSV